MGRKKKAEKAEAELEKEKAEEQKKKQEEKQNEQKQEELNEESEENEEQNEENDSEEQGFTERFSDFSENFSSRGRASPVLQPQDAERKNIEQAVADVPASAENQNIKEERGYSAKYESNYGQMSNYETSDRNSRGRERMPGETIISRAPTIAQDNVRELRKVDLESWRRSMETADMRRQMENNEDYHTEVRRVQEDRTLPFEEKRKRRINI